MTSKRTCEWLSRRNRSSIVHGLSVAFAFNLWSSFRIGSGLWAFRFFPVLICSVGSALFPQWPRAFGSRAWVALTRIQGPTESVWSTGVKRSGTGSQQALSGATAPGGSTPHICLITEPAINERFTARPVKYCTLYLLPHIKHRLEQIRFLKPYAFSNFDVYVGVPSVFARGSWDTSSGVAVVLRETETISDSFAKKDHIDIKSRGKMDLMRVASVILQA